MSSRVRNFPLEKGGTLFRPVVKSRARIATSRQPSAAVGEQLRSEFARESSLDEDTSSFSTTTPAQDQQEPLPSEQPDANSFNRLSVVPEEQYVAPRQPTLPPAAGPSLIGIPIGPVRRSTPIVVEPRKTAIPPPVSSLSASNSNGADASTPVNLTVNANSLGVESTQVERSGTALLDLNINNNSHSSTDPPIRSNAALTDSHSAPTSSGGMEPPKGVPKGKARRRKSQEDDSTKKRKRRKSGAQEEDGVENAEEALPTKQPRSRASSTPRPRKRAPSPPPYDPDADPGEDIDPTTVTMASLCSDTGQGRVSKKAAEILSNHAAWKIKNREKRARMKIMMEAKKYGREEDEEAEINAESGAPENSSAIEQGSATTSNTAAVTDDTGSGFDYSQDLATSRFNVQVRIGPNGETIIDENSLVVDRAEDDGTENYTHVVESDHTKFVNSGTYGKRYRGSRWSAEETELFYDALSQYGENYELIAYVLPGRDRKSCKNKFKVEDKRNYARINHCLDNSIPVDMKTLSRMTGKDFSGPVPEIRAPTPMPPMPPTEDEPVEDTQTQTVKKRSRSKSHGLDSGLVVIGDAETFE